MSKKNRATKVGGKRTGYFLPGKKPEKGGRCFIFLGRVVLRSLGGAARRKKPDDDREESAFAAWEKEGKSNAK